MNWKSEGNRAEYWQFASRPGPFGPAMLALAVLAIFLYFLRFVLIPFVAAGALAFALSIPVDFLSQRFELRRAAVASTVFFLVLATAGLAAYFAYPTIAAESLALVGGLKQTLTKAIAGITQGGEIHILGGQYNPSELADRAQTALRSWIGEPSNLFALASVGFSAVFGALLTVALLLYFLLGGRQIMTSLIALAPPRHRPLVTEIVERTTPILKRYFAGIGIIVTYAGIAAYLGLGLILGLKHAVVLAVATGFLELLPVLGPLLAAVLAGLVALQGASSIWDIAKYVMYATALRLSIDQVFGPLVLGRAAFLSPVTVIFCFLAGGVLYGVVGVIMAVPVALTLRITLKTIYGEADDVEGSARATFRISDGTK